MVLLLHTRVANLKYLGEQAKEKKIVLLLLTIIYINEIMKINYFVYYYKFRYKFITNVLISIRPKTKKKNNSRNLTFINISFVNLIRVTIPTSCYSIYSCEFV